MSLSILTPSDNHPQTGEKKLVKWMLILAILGVAASIVLPFVL